MDIDFLIEYTNGQKQSIEVKTDTYISPNIFYETLSCIETNSLGCMEKSKADYFYYYFEKESICYILNRIDFINWVNKNKLNFKEKTFRNKRYNGNFYTTQGLLIPKIFLEKNFKSFEKKNIN